MQYEPTAWIGPAVSVLARICGHGHQPVRHDTRAGPIQDRSDEVVHNFRFSRTTLPEVGNHPPFQNPRACGARCAGREVHSLAVFNLESGKWVPLKLDRPVNGAVWPMSIGPQTAAYEVGAFLYLFNPKLDAWDRVDVCTVGDDTLEPRATRGQ